MQFSDKLFEMRALIRTTLSPLVSQKYYLLDCPYHSNIGDQLIWQGEKAFLNECNALEIGHSSRNTFVYPKINSDIAILFHGGGNIGQLYREHIEFLFSLIENYPDNRIIVFPQTIYYKDSDILYEDITKMKSHKDFHFCVRDAKCFEIFSSAGLQHVYLLPDMAFYIPAERFLLRHDISIKGSLYLKRVDGEFAEDNSGVSADFINDWPTFGKNIFDGIVTAKIINQLAKSKISMFERLWDWYADKYYRSKLIDIGINFIKSYNPITSTRLHGIILALLCRKEVIAIDNSYGKIGEFIKTWLYDVDEVIMYTNNLD